MPRKTKTELAVDGAVKAKERSRETANLFKLAGDGTRVMVISILSRGERNVGEICSELEMSQPAVSHHLALMRHAGIVCPDRRGKNNYYSLTEKGSVLAQVVDATSD